MADTRNYMNETHITIFGEEKIPYSTSVGKVFDSINAAILFQQMQFNWNRSSNGEVFYKFFEPCEHPWYRAEDSWIEELGMSISKFRTALSKLGTRAKSREEIVELRKRKEKEFCVIYYQDQANVTWFYANRIAIDLVLKEVAKISEERYLRKREARGKIYLDPLSKGEDYGDDELILRDKESSSRIHTEKTSKNNTITDFLFEDDSDVRTEEVKLPKIKKRQQPKLTNWKNAIRMPIDFTIGDATIEIAQKTGYEALDVMDEAIKFVHYYTVGKGSTKTYPDWDYCFVHEWLNRNYRQGYLKRHGQFYKLSAGDERLDKLIEYTTTDLFADVTD